MEYKLLPHVNSPDDLKALPQESLLPLADEIRDFLCRSVSRTGGHLASNLGAVELTLAVHRVFDSPRDHIIFDVGHQSYVHKLLTGRRELFGTLRTPGGLSGFTKRSESEHDPFGAGHASTSVSAALGFAEADRLKGSDAFTVAVVGDGAYTGGLVHEALNNCKKKLNLVIILNENEMSISRNTGAFARQMNRLRASKGYYKAKRQIASFLLHIPRVGKKLYNGVSFIKRIVKNAVYGANYFEQLGLTYLGPVDGNDTVKLERILREAKLTGQATLVHVKTKKGMGYAPAEEHPALFHGIPAAGSPAIDNFSEQMGLHLCDMAEEHGNICAITAAMADGTGLIPFRKRFPDRFFDVGIAEGHAVTFAAGLAADGMKPFFAVYSTFLQRAYDNILHDAALQGLDVTLCVDRAALACGDGATHHGIYDVALLNTVPGVAIYAPADFDFLREAMDTVCCSHGVNVIRYPNCGEFVPQGYLRGKNMRYYLPRDCTCAVITYGRIVREVEAARREEDFGVILLEKLSPYAECARGIRSLLPEGVRRLVFVEEGVREGGAGMVLSEFFRDKDPAVLAIDGFAEGEEGRSYYETCGIDASSILRTVREKKGEKF